MSKLATTHPPLPSRPSGMNLAAPAWAEALVASAEPRQVEEGTGLTLQVRATGDLTLISAYVRQADALAAADFERATASAYTAIALELAKSATCHPVRFWNYIPAIHRRCGDSLDRYMVFNAGRHTACSRWFGGEAAFPRLLATASGVGHDGEDLVIHALATHQAGRAVENPRQVPAYRYSKRYGPKPPCFARATVVSLNGRKSILIGGTASVRGEESVHVGNLKQQVGETLENLLALLQAATSGAKASLDQFEDIRVYLLNPDDERTVAPLMAQAFPRAQVEFVRADICRQDLVIEIEGVAAASPE